MTYARLELLAMVHIARRDLALDDAAYRGHLANAARRSPRDESGKLISAAELSLDELGRVVESFEKLGWKPAPSSEHHHVRKVHAACKALIRVIVGNPIAAVRAVVRGVAKVEDPDLLTVEQADVLVATLKDWSARIRVARPKGASR